MAIKIKIVFCLFSVTWVELKIFRVQTLNSSCG